MEPDPTNYANGQCDHDVPYSLRYSSVRCMRIRRGLPTLTIVFMIITLMGPSGCGKTTVGSALAQRLHCPFIDADDYHSEGNRTKMARGSPLTDTDRMPWLSLMHSKLTEYPKAVLACSALKRNYRQINSDPRTGANLSYK
ncbi:hypothetical protein AHF37_11821 [Paragonimus kellicotti]|nr:hypothetical protein AHF37_11821 [Paragonimus kellicotti]